MSDAGTRAEEALARRDRCSDPVCVACSQGMEIALRALLAEQGAGGVRATKAVELLSSAKHHLRSDSPMRAAIEAFLTDAPLAPPPAPEAACPKCGRNHSDENKWDWVPTCPAPSDAAVREAAKRLWHSLTPPRSTTDDGMLLVRAEDVEAVLRALSSPAAPAKDEVREAAERCREALTSYELNGGYGVDDDAVRRLLNVLAARGGE